MIDYKILAAEDFGIIRHYRGKIAPSFIAVSKSAPDDMDFRDAYPTYDTAHAALEKLDAHECLLLRQEASGFGKGTSFCDGTERVWYHQWYLRRERLSEIDDSMPFFKSRFPTS